MYSVTAKEDDGNRAKHLLPSVDSDKKIYWIRHCSAAYFHVYVVVQLQPSFEYVACLPYESMTFSVQFEREQVYFPSSAFTCWFALVKML